MVGSSNQPLSGLTLSALLISALLMVTIGVTGIAGRGGGAGCRGGGVRACSVSGSLIQDLKAGHLLGGTPWKMQVVEIIAVAMLAFFLMGPIIALHEANLADGGIGGRSLPAPQAGLMAQLAKGIVGGQMAWGLLIIGAAFGIALIMCGAKIADAGRGRDVPAVRYRLGDLRRRGAEVGGGPHGGAPRCGARARCRREGHAAGVGADCGGGDPRILLAVLAVSNVPSLTRVLERRGGVQLVRRGADGSRCWDSRPCAWVLIAIPRRHRVRP